MAGPPTPHTGEQVMNQSCPNGRRNKKASIECLKKADPKELVAAELGALTDGLTGSTRVFPTIVFLTAVNVGMVYI